MTKTLRFIVFAEAVTLIALMLIAMPLKYAFSVPAATSIVGPIHGFAFMLFFWFVAHSWGEGIIKFRGVLRLLAGALVPFGGFINERWLHAQFANGNSE